MRDEVIAMKDGFYAMVAGKLHGPWLMREYAEAGLQVEQRRIKSLPELYAQADEIIQNIIAYEITGKDKSVIDAERARLTETRMKIERFCEARDLEGNVVV